ncbi:MAG: outer membrane protein [Sphingomicrobium sp.]
MRKFLLAAAVAAAAVASPASANDRGGYIGLEGGFLFPRTTHVDGKFSDGSTTFVGKDLFGIKYKTGYDLDVIAGYDLGMFRLEGELGYKRAGLDRLSIPSSTLNEISDALGVPITADDLSIEGHTRVLSGMVNGLVDFGGPNFGVYAGGGVGLAGVKLGGGGDSVSKTRFAWQLIAGARAPVSSNVDLGLKYRYFRSGKLRFSDQFAADDSVYTASIAGRFSSHSLLASVAYNFGSRGAPIAAAPAYAPPPPPPVANVQTCPDGSTVPVGSACPNSYAPPPPPPPPPSYRGERG